MKKYYVVYGVLNVSCGDHHDAAFLVGIFKNENNYKTVVEHNQGCGVSLITSYKELSQSDIDMAKDLFNEDNLLTDCLGEIYYLLNSSEATM